MDQQEPIQTEYDEIDLMDYIKVLIKRKWLILVIFFVAAIAAGIFSFLMPKVYRIDTSLEIGKIADGKIENPSQVIEKIKGDVYGILTREKLGISEEKYPKIKVENPKDTGLIKMEIESANPELAKNILTEINELILKEHQEQFDKKKAKIEESIKEIQAELSLVEKQKIYADESIAQLQITLSNLKSEMSAAEPTKILKNPTISAEPIKPRPLLNIVIAAVLGLFVGVFWAFFQEWWQKSKPNLDKKT